MQAVLTDVIKILANKPGDFHPGLFAFYDMKIKLIAYILLLCCGCDASTEQVSLAIPDHIEQLKNLTVFNPTKQPTDTIRLEKQTVFKSNSEVFIEGYITDIAVDDSNRVYIGAGGAASAGIYVFRPDGSFLSTIGAYGRGPGEFLGIGSLLIWNNRLYVFDPKLQKFCIYSLMNFKHISDGIISKKRLPPSDTLAQRLRASKLFLNRQENELLIQLSAFSQFEELEVDRKRLYRISESGLIQPGYVLNLQRFPFYFPKNGEMRFPFTMPFSPNSVVSISPKGPIFTAWTADFLIKKYDTDGNYINSFYYPVEASSLSLKSMDVSTERMNVLNHYSMPDTWPVLHTMLVDDKERIWAVRIVDSEKKFEWWVLSKNGELIAKFDFPGVRSKRTVMNPPILKVKNGYLYLRKFDFHNGIDQIVKYKIEMGKSS